MRGWCEIGKEKRVTDGVGGRHWCEQCQSWRFGSYHCGREECQLPAHRNTESEEVRAYRLLLADLSEALKFVREMSIQPCPHTCFDDCLACRAKAWLHESRPKP
jgi:hypothetical protein